MMTNLVLIDDTTLRLRLRLHRFKPDGPITDTTREVYFRKLQQLDDARANGVTAALGGLAMTSTLGNPAQTTTHETIVNSATPLLTTPTASSGSTAVLGSRRLPALEGSQRLNDLVARSAPLQDAGSIQPSIIVHGTLGNKFLANYNDRTHVTSDVCFISHDGGVLFASRALLVTSCPGMTQLLYNTSQSLPICLHISTGSMVVWCHLDDLVITVKYKITLLKGIPVYNQTLLLDGQTLSDDAALYSCGVQTNSVLEVQTSSTSNAVVNFRAATINPSLSIIKFTPLLSTEGGSQELPVMSESVLLPHQVVQLVITSDVPANLLNDFIQYLYTGNIVVTIDSAPTLCALSEALTIHDLQEISIKVVDDNINNGNIKDLLSFSHRNQVQSIKDCCLRHVGHCNRDQLCQHFYNSPELVEEIMNT